MNKKKSSPVRLCNKRTLQILQWDTGTNQKLIGEQGNMVKFGKKAKEQRKLFLALRETLKNNNLTENELSKCAIRA